MEICITLYKSSIKSSPAGRSGAERRSKERLSGPFHARVRVVDRAGNLSKVETFVENISAGGLYLHLEQDVEPGAALFVVTEFSKAWTRKARRACVAARGSVLRVERDPAGGYGVAFTISNHRFLHV